MFELKQRWQVSAAAIVRRARDLRLLDELAYRRAFQYALDVTDSAQVHQVVNQAYAHFGNLDVLVNNAGASLFATTEEASDEKIRGIFDTNYLGIVRVLRAALPLLRKRENGHILVV